MKYKNIHIGKKIKQKLCEKNISITDFAKEISCSRTNVYNIFGSKSLDIDKIVKISKALNYNFIQDYLPSIPQNNKTTFTIEIENGQVKIVEK